MAKSSGTLIDLVERLGGRYVDLPAHRLVHAPSLDVAEGFTIRSGIVWLYKLGSSGRRHAVALRFTGEIVLPYELAMGLDAQTLVPSRLARFPGKAFDAWFETDKSARQLLARTMARQHRIALEWLARSTFDPEEKIAHFLCETAFRSGHDLDPQRPFDLPFTQRQIGFVTGQTASSVNRVLGDWQRGNVLIRSERRYTVDWAELERIGRFDRSYLL
ncbi:MAG TPA: Crp/Fnr family transcriptional regulator [Sphingomicrobium sp.]|nr:Crp/Fnr family transcriptional regulator [Sphingomicrobium sp.]